MIDQADGGESICLTLNSRMSGEMKNPSGLVALLRQMFQKSGKKQER